jgi:hypothetical protein
MWILQMVPRAMCASRAMVRMVAAAYPHRAKTFIAAFRMA